MFRGAEPLVQFLKGHYEEQFYEIILYLYQWFRKCPLKTFGTRALAAPFSVEQNQLRNFLRKHHEEEFCEIILNLDK